ncbi:MAG TPA: glycoside hydrolase domain-containing protein, partial [Planctomycetota bacterium]|nr:glycoside hydrolase domain-containing protein [Planctomycetota bacterium]
MKLRNVVCVCAAVVATFAGASATAATQVWVESSGVMILPDRAAGTQKSIERSGVRNEYVTAQIAVRSDADEGVPLTFEWTGLNTPNGTAIGKEHVTLFRGADIVVGPGRDRSIVSEEKDKPRARALGTFPDALVPLYAADGTNVANRIAPEKDRTIPFWVDVFIPEKTPPGDYTGTITLKSGAAVVATVPVKVKVLAVTLPADSTIPSLFNLRLHPHVNANLDTYVAEALRHRVSPTNYHYMDYIERRDGFATMDRYNPDGRGDVNVYISETRELTPDRSKRIVDQLRKVTAHLKGRKLFDRSFIYLKDEPSRGEIAGVVAVAKLIREQVPEWKGKILCTCTSEGAELDAVLDIQARALKMYGMWYMQSARMTLAGREGWEKRRAQGKVLWFYVSNAQGYPFPTFDIQTVNLAWEPRVFGWAFWYEKAQGHLYWDLMFTPAWKLSGGFPPGDGQLMYPGDFTMEGAPAWVLVKDLKGPAVSRRLKHQREGLEEWELLKLAEKKVGRAKVEAVADKVYTCMGRRTWAPDAYNPAKPDWSYDEPAWDRARDEVI